MATNAIILLATGGLSFQAVKSALFPAPPADQVTSVKIGAGSNGDNDGNIPGIHLFDFQGKTIGIQKSSGNIIDKGKDFQINVAHLELNDNAAAQAEYISIVTGGKDALCISYVTVTLPGSGVQFAYNGDFGYQCGAAWAYGNTTLTADPNGGIYQPRCNWIDGDDSNGLHTKAIGVHLPSVLANQGRIDQYNKDNDLMCKADPRFKLYDTLDVEDPIPYFKSSPFDLDTLIDYNRDQTLDPNNWATTPVDKSKLKGIGSERRDIARHGGNQTLIQGNQNYASSVKSNSKVNAAGNNSTKTLGTSTFNGTRVAPPQSEKHRGQLIKSGSQYHSAKELCGSATSYGPDFVSLVENLYCDMEQKKTWPLCQNAAQNACFDNDANKMRFGPGNNRRDGKGVVLPRKVYTKVEQW
jgi:hypothetical protein